MNNFFTVNNENYEILGILGEGSYGKVFKVRNICNNKHFAVKKIKY